MLNRDDKDTGQSGAQAGEGASTIDQSPVEGRDPGPTEKPSQAEGDRDTIDTDIREKEGSA